MRAYQSEAIFQVWGESISLMCELQRTSVGWHNVTISVAQQVSE